MLSTDTLEPDGSLYYKVVVFTSGWISCLWSARVINSRLFEALWRGKGMGIKAGRGLISGLRFDRAQVSKYCWSQYLIKVFPSVSGNSTVEFKCVEETDLILIHSNKLNYTTLENNHLARLTSVNGDKAPSITKSWLQPVTQYLVLQLDGKLTKDQHYQLFTEFTGELADDLGGFYRSEYWENGELKYVFPAKTKKNVTSLLF